MSKRDFEVVTEFDEDGNPTVSVVGFQGPGCVQLTEDLQTALGETTSSQKTAEFDQAKEVRRERNVARH